MDLLDGWSNKSRIRTKKKGNKKQTTIEEHNATQHNTAQRVSLVHESCTWVFCYGKPPHSVPCFLPIADGVLAMVVMVVVECYTLSCHSLTCYLFVCLFVCFFIWIHSSPSSASGINLLLRSAFHSECGGEWWRNGFVLLGVVSIVVYIVGYIVGYIGGTALKGEGNRGDAMGPLSISLSPSTNILLFPLLLLLSAVAIAASLSRNILCRREYFFVKTRVFVMGIVVTLFFELMVGWVIWVWLKKDCETWECPKSSTRMLCMWGFIQCGQHIQRQSLHSLKRMV